VLTLGVIFLTNILFPPAQPQTNELGALGDSATAEQTVRDSIPAAESLTGRDPTAELGAAPATVDPATVDRAVVDPAPRQEPGDTIVVSSPRYRYGFTDIGAALVSITLPEYLDYSPNGNDDHPVELVRSGDRLLGYRIAVGGAMDADTIDLRDVRYDVIGGDIVLSDEAPRDSLVFRYAFPDSELAFELTYRFDVSTYQVEVTGRFSRALDRGYTVLTSLGRGMRTNEANEKEDFHALGFVVRDRNGKITSEGFDDLEPGITTAAEGGPFSWVAVKNKYFLLSFIAPESSPGFGGFLVSGTEEEHSGRMVPTIPVPAGADGFAFDAFLGPQDFERLAAIGQDLQNVNPYGWRWMRPIIKPLVGLILAILTWFHTTFNLAYGWVLILFGVLMRVVLFPLYQKSMRAQMAQMRVQPQMKEIQAKYKDDPTLLQQEMMKLYKEHGVNPLGGCLPMLLPFPILITLFFVFQNTIVFRGVPFLWLPDLSLADPLYIVPVLMGASMLLLGWIGQRGMEVTGQMKVMAYAMPIVFTFLFLNFPSGLNLYYASMNFASLPQQLYLSKERKAARQVGTESPAGSEDAPPEAAKPKKEPQAKKGSKPKQRKSKQSKSKKRGA
jgi:YidC/Oxa1 family membrane protein insertase